MIRGRTLLPAVILSGAFVAASCGPRLVALPSGSGRPLADYAAAYTRATAHCRDVKTLSAILAISGRAAGSRFRAKVDGGFEAPARLRLELPAPGRPIFTFVADGDTATLVFPRDGRVLRDAPAAATLEALAGVAIAPRDLRAIVTGCGFAGDRPSAGREYDGPWAAIDLDVDGSTLWLRQPAGAWRIAAATRGPLDVRYADFVGDRPSTIRLRAASDSQGKATDLTIKLSDVDVNQALGPEVFQVEIPDGATPMTLDELRQAGPLGR